MHSTLGAFAVVLLVLLPNRATARCERELGSAYGTADDVGRAVADVHRRLRDARAAATITAAPSSACATTPTDASAARVLAEAGSSLREVGLGAVNLEALPLDRPAARGLRHALSRLRARLTGVATPAITAPPEASSTTPALEDLEPAVGLPLVAGQVGTAAVAAAFRWTTARLLSRSRETLLNTLFVLDLHVSARWPELFSDERRPGLPPGWREFVAAQGVVVAVPTIFFYLAFRHGAYRWEALAAEDPARIDQARRTTTALTPLVFAVSGPVLAWATAPARALAHLGPMALHPGQLTLTGLAVGAGLLATRPHLFDHAVPLVERLVYQPLGRARDAWDDFASQFKTAPLVHASAVDK